MEDGVFVLCKYRDNFDRFVRLVRIKPNGDCYLTVYRGCPVFDFVDIDFDIYRKGYRPIDDDYEPVSVNNRLAKYDELIVRDDGCYNGIVLRKKHKLDICEEINGYHVNKKEYDIVQEADEDGVIVLRRKPKP